MRHRTHQNSYERVTGSDGAAVLSGIPTASYRFAVVSGTPSWAVDVYKNGVLIGTRTPTAGRVEAGDGSGLAVTFTSTPAIGDVFATEYDPDGVERVLRSGSAVSHLRVLVRDAAGAWVDLSSLEGHNWIVSASWREDVDQPVASAEIELVREHGLLSLAALMDGSKLNLSASGYAPLLDLRREVQIQTATIPAGSMPVLTDWQTMFHGRIDDIDWTSSPIRIQARDLAGRLQEVFLERELFFGYGIFGSDGVVPGVETWQPSADIVLDSMTGTIGAPSSGYVGLFHVQSLVGVALTGATEPTWPASGTVQDNTIIWARRGNAVNSRSLGAAMTDIIVASRAFDLGIDNWTITEDSPYAPVAVLGDPNWQLNPWRQARAPVLDALRRLAQMIGWDVRMKWSSAEGRFRLTLFSVDRTKILPDRVFGPSDYIDVRSLRLSAAGIRNSVTVHYNDASDLYPDGTPRRKSVTVKDQDSIDRYERVWCEVGEDSSSLIDSSTEATALANAVLNDLKMPHFEKQVEAPYFWPAELGDLYEFAPNGVHYSTAQRLAVVGIEHRLSPDGAGRTTLTVRGNVAGGYRTWHQKLARPGVARSSRQLAPSAPTGLSAQLSGNVTLLKFTPPAERFAGAELHKLANLSATPTSSTLIARGAQTSFALILPSGTHLLRVVAYDEYGNRSAPSAAISIQMP